MALRASCRDNVGWSRNYDGSGQRNGLNQRQRHVAGAGRQVDDEVVEFSPHHRTQKLPDNRVQHGTAPDQRLVAGIQEAYRNNFQPMGFERLNAIVTHHFRLTCKAEHQWNVRTVDIGV